MAEEGFISSSRTKRIIGRKVEIQAVRRAMDNRKPRVLMFVGPGGMGKTRLLEEVGRLAKASKKRRVLWSGVIDAYHPEAHTDLGIQDLIANNLERPNKNSGQSNKYFAKYRLKANQYLKHVAEGFGGRVLEQEREALDKAFVEDYKRLAAKYRIVLTFDTLELIEYESEVVQRICKIEQETTTLKNWLLLRIPQLPNTVTILAGRTVKFSVAAAVPYEQEHAQVWMEFERAFQAAGLFQPERDRFVLKEFTTDEADAYFEDLEENNPDIPKIGQTQRGKLWKRAEGRPIRQSLVIDLLLHGENLEWLDDTSKLIDDQLVEMLLKLTGPTQLVLRYLPAARKGLNADMMHYLEPDISNKEWAKQLDGMKGYAFVKTRPDTDLIFLHDELYEILERNSDLADRETARRRYEQIAKYYRLRLGDVGKKLKELRDEPFERKEPLLKEHQGLMLDLLHYELQIDAAEGFRRVFTQWDDEAIEGREIDLDNKLRDELWRFLNSPVAQLTLVKEKIDLGEISRDSAVRWVRRYLAREEFAKAREVAESILASGDELFKTNDPLFWGDLHCAYGEALLYLSAPAADILGALNRAIELLDGDVLEANRDPWKRDRILGRAYNDLGFYWTNAGSGTKTINALRSALPYQKNMPIEHANTLNNLAFRLAKLGRIDPAQLYVEQAIKLRKELGHPFPLALSYNVQGYIHVLADHPMWGMERCQEALEILGRIGLPRGIGLALIGLGFACRKRADQWKLGVYAAHEAEKYFAQAEKHLKESRRIFESQIKEPFELWEACNELGSTYCDWGFLLQSTRGRPAAELKWQQSVDAQARALAVARENGLVQQEIDSLDDLAQVSRDKGDIEQAQEYLDRIAALIPGAYRLVPGKGFQDIANPDEVYWLHLGKLHLQRGIWGFHDFFANCDEADKKKCLARAVTDYCLAVAYFIKYWPSSYNFRLTLRSFAQHLAQSGSGHADEIRQTIERVALEYRVNLQTVLETLDDTLGI